MFIWQFQHLCVVLMLVLFSDCIFPYLLLHLVIFHWSSDTVYQMRGSGVGGRPCAALYSGREFGCILFAAVVGAEASECPSVPLCLPVSLGLPDCFSAETVCTLQFVQLQPTVTVLELCWYGFRVCADETLGSESQSFLPHDFLTNTSYRMGDSNLPF